MRTCLSALILIVAQIAGVACAQSAANAGIAASGRLRVAMIGANPVLVTKAPDGNLSGISVDLGKLISAQLVRVSGSVDAAVAALKNGEADVYGSNGQFVYLVADRLPRSRILPGAFTSVPMAVALAQGRSPAALAKLAQIVNEAKSTGIVQQAIKRAELRGVRVAPD